MNELFAFSPDPPGGREPGSAPPAGPEDGCWAELGWRGGARSIPCSGTHASPGLAVPVPAARPPACRLPTERGTRARAPGSPSETWQGERYSHRHAHGVFTSLSPLGKAVPNPKTSLGSCLKRHGFMYSDFRDVRCKCGLFFGQGASSAVCYKKHTSICV